jgi:hypothetical protein
VHGKGPYYVWSPVPNAGFKAANRLLAEGYSVSRSLDEVELDGMILKPGAFIVEHSKGLEKLLGEMASELGLDFHGVDRPLPDTFELRRPRVGVYRAWLPNADEGWLRMVLEEYGFEYVNLYPEDVRAGGLSGKVDVLVFPDLTRDIVVDGMKGYRGSDPSAYEERYRRGVEEQGNKEVLRFLDAGGTVITLNRSCEYAVRDLYAGAELPLAGLGEKEFYCPGSLLRVLVDDSHPIGYGYGREETVMFQGSPAFNVKEGVAVAWYPETDPTVSGWLLGEKHLRGRAAVAEVPAGNGTVILIGCSPHFRNQNRATFKLLFNSIYYGVA